jgi:hypothetical protein
VRMGYRCHGESLTNLLPPCNRLPINRRTGHCDGMALVLGLRRDAVWTSGARS